MFQYFSKNFLAAIVLYAFVLILGLALFIVPAVGVGLAADAGFGFILLLFLLPLILLLYYIYYMQHHEVMSHRGLFIILFTALTLIDSFVLVVFILPLI